MHAYVSRHTPTSKLPLAKLRLARLRLAKLLSRSRCTPDAGLRDLIAASNFPRIALNSQEYQIIATNPESVGAR